MELSGGRRTRLTGGSRRFAGGTRRTRLVGGSRKRLAAGRGGKNRRTKEEKDTTTTVTAFLPVMEKSTAHCTSAPEKAQRENREKLQRKVRGEEVETR